MASTRPMGPEDRIWGSLLALRSFLKGSAGQAPPRVWLCRDAAGWSFATAPTQVPERDAVVEIPLVAESEPRHEEPPAGRSHASWCQRAWQRGEEPFHAKGAVPLPHDEAHALRLYLPLVLGGHQARATGAAFVTAHLAQSLDGRIACTNGHSQWIGNHENLVHAHRLRALHDAILVGRRTAETDDPQLTVRHVHGPNPERVVLSASGSVLAKTGSLRLFQAPGATVVCGEGRAGGAHEVSRVRTLEVALDSGACAPRAVAASLAARGHHATFVEGGAGTLSSFLAADAIDVLHLHLAPLVLGSGIASFTLPEVARIGDGRRFVITSFRMADEILLECRPLRNPSQP